MGGAKWNHAKWEEVSADSRGKMRGGASVQSVTASRMHKDLDPRNIVMRESCDSTANPFSTPIFVAFDVTGSMHIIPKYFIESGLPTLVADIVQKEVVADPHLALAAIGDVTCDNAPFQVSQFEGDSSILPQLLKFYLEGGGGGNPWESYNLPWWFAANRVKLDCVIKGRGRGFLFTVGDENVPDPLTSYQLQKVFGPGDYPAEISNVELIAQAGRNFEVFHILITQGRGCVGDALEQWKSLMPPGRLLVLDDYTKLSETIIAAISMFQGASLERSTSYWGDKGKSSLVKAVSGVVPRKSTVGLIEV